MLFSLPLLLVELVCNSVLSIDLQISCNSSSLCDFKCICMQTTCFVFLKYIDLFSTKAGECPNIISDKISLTSKNVHAGLVVV